MTGRSAAKAEPETNTSAASDVRKVRRIPRFTYARTKPGGRQNSTGGTRVAIARRTDPPIIGKAPNISPKNRVRRKAWGTEMSMEPLNSTVKHPFGRTRVFFTSN